MTPWEIIEEVASQESMQNWTQERPLLMQALRLGVSTGALKMLVNERRRVVFLITPRSDIVMHLHLMSAAHNLRDLAVAIKQFRQYMINHETCLRVECQTHRPGLVRLLTNNGGVLEGVSRKAFKLESGEVTDLYNIAWLREDV